MRTIFTLGAFSLAIVLAQWVPVLPERALSIALLVAASLSALFLLFRRQRPPIAISLLLAFTIGASFAWLRADLRMANELPREWEGRDIELVGVIDELPQADAQGLRFAFAVERVLTAEVHVPPRIALGWYKATIRELQGEPLPTLHAGERWQLTVRLKRPHGYANPNGYDVEAWLLENNLRATGSVRSDEPNRRLAANAGRAIDHVNQLRDHLRERMQRALAERRYGGVLIALALGDQRAISEADWCCSTRRRCHICSRSAAHM